MTTVGERLSIPASIPELISCWKSIADFSTDVGCGYEAARKFRDRASIPPVHWERVINAAKNKGIPGIDWEWLGRKCAESKS